jgi:hypothetical protein
MKLHRKHDRRVRARVDRLVTIVALLWLATTLALLLSYQTSSAQAAHPRKTIDRSIALYVPQAADRASLIY